MTNTLYLIETSTDGQNWRTAWAANTQRSALANLARDGHAPWRRIVRLSRADDGTETRTPLAAGRKTPDADHELCAAAVAAFRNAERGVPGYESPSAAADTLANEGLVNLDYAPPGLPAGYVVRTRNYQLPHDDRPMFAALMATFRDSDTVADWWQLALRHLETETGIGED